MILLPSFKIKLKTQMLKLARMTVDLTLDCESIIFLLYPRIDDNRTFTFRIPLFCFSFGYFVFGGVGNHVSLYELKLAFQT